MAPTTNTNLKLHLLKFFRSVVPNFFGTGDRFDGRQFFYGPGRAGGGMIWGWFKHILFIVHFINISIIITLWLYDEIIVIQSLSRVWFFAILWTAAHQASLSSTVSRSLLKLMSIELVIPSNHLILCCPLLLLQNQIIRHQILIKGMQPRLLMHSSQ